MAINFIHCNYHNPSLLILLGLHASYDVAKAIDKVRMGEDDNLERSKS